MKSILIALASLVVIKVQAQLVDGYTDKLSYRSGEVVKFYTKATTNSLFPVVLPVNNATGAATGASLSFSSTVQAGFPSDQRWVKGYNYSQTASWTIPSNLKSGIYTIPATTPIPVIVKAPNKTNVDVVIVVPTNTDAAYCCKIRGDKSLYYDYTVHVDTTVGPGVDTVSFHRPMRYTIASDYSGFPKWLVNANPFATRVVSVIADSDMDDYSEIANAKLLIVIGHSEYWTRQARANFDQFVDSGKNAMILSGNSFWWQVRYVNDVNNPRVICHRYPAAQDPVTDVSLRTIHWNDPALEYSILGSIGTSFGMFNVEAGLFGTDASEFKGYKIIRSNSPIFSNVKNGSGGTIGNGDIITFDTGEYDGTLFSGFDTNGFPVLDVSGLGFYRAELLGYDLIYDPSPPTNPQIAPMLIFQKTATSGKIFNGASNEWCADGNFNGTFGQQLRQITLNVANLFLNNSSVFTSPAPATFSIKPVTNNTVSVVYQSCPGGVISIQQGGVYITNGFKTEHLMNGMYNNNRFISNPSIDPSTSHDTPFFMIGSNNCTTPITTGRTATNSGDDVISNVTSTAQAEISVYPNPTDNFLTISVSTASRVVIYNSQGSLVYSQEIFAGTSDIDLTKFTTGFYILTITSESGFYQTKIMKSK